MGLLRIIVTMALAALVLSIICFKDLFMGLIDQIPCFANMLPYFDIPFYVLTTILVIWIFAELATVIWESGVTNGFTKPFDREQSYENIDDHVNDLSVKKDWIYYLGSNARSYMKRGYKSAQASQMKAGEGQENFHALIIVPNLSAKMLMYGNGIDLLIEHFNAESINYEVTECKTPRDFKDIVLNNCATHLWIFGHGSRHSVSFGTKTLFYYELIEEINRTGLDLPKKQFIAQLHCNTGGGKSLADYLVDDKSKRYVNNELRYIFQNREDIKYILSHRLYE